MMGGRKTALGVSFLFATACVLLYAYPKLDSHIFSNNPPATSLSAPAVVSVSQPSNVRPIQPAIGRIESLEAQTLAESEVVDLVVANSEVNVVEPRGEPQSKSTETAESSSQYEMQLTQALDLVNSAANSADEFDQALAAIEATEIYDAEHLSSKLLDLTSDARIPKSELASLSNRIESAKGELQRFSKANPERAPPREKTSDVQNFVTNAKQANVEWKSAANRIAALLKKYKMLEQARSPEVQAALAVVLKPRDVQPRKSGGSLQLRRTFETTPMSYAAIRNTGALASSIDGLRWLSKIVGDRRLKERWAINIQPNNWSEDDKKRLKETQGYLIKYGATLVEDGQLIP